MIMAESEQEKWDESSQYQQNQNSQQTEFTEWIETTSEIRLNAHFASFISLRNAIDKYQNDNHVQLVVKDSKLLSTESTRKIIPKVYHLVNQKLMYHSITYSCKFHGRHKRKYGSRIKKVGANNLRCPMYMRFKLSADFQSLVMFEIFEVHNHPIDYNTFKITPRQQVYRITAIERGQPDPGDFKRKTKNFRKSAKRVHDLIDTAIKDVNSISSLGDKKYEKKSPQKTACLPSPVKNKPSGSSQSNSTRVIQEESSGILEEESSRIIQEENSDDDDVEQMEEDRDGELYKDNPCTPLDPESSCSDSDEEEFRKQRDLLPYPTRLIGSALQCNPELTLLTKELIASQLEVLNSSKKKLLLQNKMLELQNAKLALELEKLEKSLSKPSEDEGTTFYVQS